MITSQIVRLLEIYDITSDGNGYITRLHKWLDDRFSNLTISILEDKSILYTSADHTKLVLVDINNEIVVEKHFIWNYLMHEFYLDDHENKQVILYTMRKHYNIKESNYFVCRGVFH